MIRVKTQKTVTEKGRRLRVAGLVMAGVMVWSSLIPLFGVLLEARIYNLSPQASQVVGEVNSNLSDKFSYNQDKKTWQFNREGLALKADAIAEQQGKNNSSEVASALSQLQQQVGGGGKDDDSLYSVNLPEDGSKAVTYYDNNTQLSFKMTPQFSLRDGKLKDGQIVYPLYGGGQLVYTAKTNGLKEDIVLEESRGDNLTFSYKLKLPDTLEAHLRDDGSVGIFSADIVLYTATAGSDGDQAKLDNARETAPKDYLLFALPAPVIKDAKGVEKPGKFTLKDDVLTVHASDLDSLVYPLSVDPSVVITSSSDFTAGNNEGGIDFSASGQMNGMKPTGASVGAWNTGPSLGYESEKNVSVIHNGYIYAGGGENNYTPAEHSELYYATVNASTGAVGSWTSATTLPTPGNNNDRATLMPYNGYMYYVSAYATGGSTSVMRFYSAPINSNGSLGVWTEIASSGPTGDGAFGSRALIYNGYMYISGGGTGVNDSGNCPGANNCRTDVYYAPIRAGGTIGSWTATSSFATGRAGHGFVAYDGRLYVTGGVLSGAGFTTQVYLASINSDGSLGSWLSTTVLAEAQGDHTSYVYNGYLYIIGGRSGTGVNVRFAQINANGTLGSWVSTTALSTQRSYIGSNTAVANGYLYIVNGRNSGGSVDYDSVIYAKVNSAGITNAWTNESDTLSVARSGSCLVAYNNYLYTIGGSTSGTRSALSTVVEYASINSDGATGAWTTTTALPVVRGFQVCTAHNGYMYVASGISPADTGATSVLYAPINSSGTLGAWTTSGNAMPNRTTYGHMFTYTTPDGTTRLYAVGDNVAGAGGENGSQSLYYTTVNPTTGAPSTWTAATSQPPTVSFPGYTNVGKYLYEIGGEDGSTVNVAMIQSTGNVTSWTSTTALPTGVSYNRAVTVNGCIYTIGGWVSSTAQSNVYYACPNADGTISAWNTGPSLVTAVGDSAVSSYNGYIYAAGGRGTSATINTVAYTKVNNGGRGGIIGSAWQVDGDIAVVDNRFRHATIVYNGYIYMIGGSVNGGGAITTQTVEYAPINANGTLGAWVADTHELPTARTFPGAIAYNGYMYVLGGQDASSNFLKSILYAPISSTGALSANWASAGSNTTNGGAGASLAAHKGYLYSLGGWDGSTDYNTVQYAPINSNGTIGAWSSTSSFTTSRSDLTSFAYGGYMYVVGGEGSSLMSDVQYAPINSNGTLGSWSHTRPFVGARKDSNITAYNGFMYVTGGNDAAESRPDVQFAPMLADGTVGPWQRAFAPVNGDPVGSRSPSGQSVWNGRLYAAGGGMLNGASSTTMSGSKYLELDSLARTARYSKLVALPSQGGTATVNYNGTYAPDTTLKFATASSDNIFGALTNGTAGAGSDPGSTCSAPTINTVWLSATIDDSRQATFGGGTSSSITDISVFYTDSGRPAPSQRMFGGKSFRSEILRPLDTCGNV